MEQLFLTYDLPKETAAAITMLYKITKETARSLRSLVSKMPKRIFSILESLARTFIGAISA